MRTFQSRVFQSRAWQHHAGQPRLFPAPAVPGGAPIVVLAVVLAVALALHGFQRANDRWRTRAHVDLYGDPHDGGEIVGRVRVIDGDTIVIRRTHIRLLGIDAPEADQTCTDTDNKAWRCGQAATRVLLARIAGRSLTCATAGFDRYRRVLATCALPDGSDVNAWMVQQGWALAYYSDVYRPQEAEAQAAKRGIWAGTFIPPWVWRHRHLHQGADASTRSHSLMDASWMKAR
jgi:endonuclease YncB( thermonuclease family)